MNLRPATVVIGERTVVVDPGEPFVFGRSDAPGVVGLDDRDRGISAVAGAVEAAHGLWWVVNRSSKRKLLLDEGRGTQPYQLEPSLRFAITVPALAVVVVGEILTHRLEIAIDKADLGASRADAVVSTNTITAEDVGLSHRDREALVALCSGYLREAHRQSRHPLTYQDAAEMLGPPWTKVTVRKQIERLRERLAKRGVYFDGARANYELAEYLIANRILQPGDLAWLAERRARET